MSVNGLAGRAAASAQVGKSAQARRLYRLAGEQAVASGDYEAALTFFSQALDMVPDSQPDRRYVLLRHRAAVLSHLGRHQAQERDLISLATLADRLDDDRRRADAGACMAEFKCARGDFRDTLAIAHLALRLAQIAAAAKEIVLLEQLLGRAHLRLGDYCQAESKLKCALSRARALNWSKGTADSLRFIGVLHLERGEFARARDHYEEALAIYAQLTDQPGQADILNNLGNVAHAQGDFSSAEAYWDKAQPIYKAIGDQQGLCRILVNLSAVYIDVGYYTEARQTAESALATSQELALTFGETLAHINLALVLHFQGQPETARQYGLAALELAQTMGSRRLEGYALTTLGKVEIGSGNGDEARDHYWQSLALWQELEQPNLEMESRAGLVQIALENGTADSAQMHIDVIYDYLSLEPAIDGTESPFDVYLVCYRGLAATQDSRAEAVLQAGHALLQARSAAIENEAMRRSFLRQVATHRELADRFQADGATHSDTLPLIS